MGVHVRLLDPALDGLFSQSSTINSMMNWQHHPSIYLLWSPA